VQFVVVDDGTRDPEILQELRRASEELDFELRCNHQNLGFSASVNHGMRRARGRYVVLCNSDIAFFQPWLEAVERTGHGTAESTVVSGRDLVEEALMMGLRLSDGIDRTIFAANTGADPVEALGEAALAPLVAAGFLEVSATHLGATAAGRQRLNAVLERLVA